jgi:hypothetical protein
MAKEIFYCNLTVLFKGKPVELKEVVYKETDGYYRKKTLFKEEPVKVIKVDVIKSLGFSVEQNGHTEVKKSDEQRNKVTGAYD